MDNFYVNTLIKPHKDHYVVDSINRALRFFKKQYKLQRLPNSMVDMTTLEQRINYFHLLDGVIKFNIPGDVIELGCFTGQCAMLLQKIIQSNESDKKLHLFDSFEKTFTIKESVDNVLMNNFKNAGLNIPVIHKGYFQDTIPNQLPEQISFVHIDCGFGGDPFEHKEILLHCLDAIYHRLSKNAVCVLMDYHNQGEDNISLDCNPGVKLACDEFFLSKPEIIFSLFGNQYAHAYFRKN